MSCDDFESAVAAAFPAEIAGKQLLIGVSGGADSVGLLRSACRLSSVTPFRVIAAHLNHQLRGEQSQADQRWVAELCARLDVPLECRHVDIQRQSREQQITLEEAARNARYDFLTSTAVRCGCPFVAVAHTADDQTETVLHHLLRGTGIAGLRGMPAIRRLQDTEIHLIRPLLGIRRLDTETYLREIGQDFVTDATNSDEQFTRNRIRHTLLPQLREHFNPQVDEALRRLSQNAAETFDALESMADELLNAALLELSSEICRLNCPAMRDSHPHIVRTAFTLLWQRVGWPRQAMNQENWHRLAGLVQKNGAVTLPRSIDARSRGDLLVLRRHDFPRNSDTPQVD